jgi:hypothetical protein
MDRIEGIELLRKHENLPEGYNLEFEEILDDIQLKKLKILKMKYNPEKIQHKSTGLSKKDINSMAGEKVKSSLKEKTEKINIKKYEEDQENENEELEEEFEEDEDEDEEDEDIENKNKI